jgi:hypothetical protein
MDQTPEDIGAHQRTLPWSMAYLQYNVRFRSGFVAITVMDTIPAPAPGIPPNPPRQGLGGDGAGPGPGALALALARGLAAGGLENFWRRGGVMEHSSGAGF